MRKSQKPLHVGSGIYLPWPSTLATRDLPGLSPTISLPNHGLSSDVRRTSGPVYTAPQTAVAENIPTFEPSKHDAVRDLPELFPRLAEGSKPIIVSSPKKDETVAALLSRKKIRRPTQALSKQADILADLLGGTTATWELASVMFSESGATNLTICADSSTNIQIQARVLYVDFIKSQVCFKLTAGTIETLTEHHLSVYSNQPEAQKLINAFKQANDDFVYFAEVGCLGGIRRDGSGKLTAGHCTKVRAAILKLFGLSGH